MLYTNNKKSQLKKRAVIGVLSSFIVFAITNSVIALDTNATESTDRFDLVQTIRDSPLLTGSLQIGKESYGGRITGNRFRSKIFIRTVFLIDFDTTRFFYKVQGQEAFRALNSLHGAIYIPLRKISLAYGGGWMWHSGNPDGSGPSTYLLVLIRPTPQVEFDSVLERSLIKNKLNNLTDIGFSIGGSSLQIRCGYRWLHLNKETFSGPNISLKVHF